MRLFLSWTFEVIGFLKRKKAVSGEFEEYSVEVGFLVFRISFCVVGDFVLKLFGGSLFRGLVVFAEKLMWG